MILKFSNYKHGISLQLFRFSFISCGKLYKFQNIGLYNYGEIYLVLFVVFVAT